MSTRTELLVQKLLSQVVSQNAQELHLIAGQQPILRQDGALKAFNDEQLLVEDFILDIAKSILSSAEWEQLEQKRSLVTVKEVSSIGRFQITCYFQRETLAITVKFIPTQIPDFAELNLPQVVEPLVSMPRGLVLVSGPFDSGRTTMAAALLQKILVTKAVRVMTLEQPLEYLLVSRKGIVEQRQVGRDVESFDAGVKLATQEDVDVLFLSDVPTPYVADELIDMALSNKLVIATMTSDSSIRSVQEFITMAAEHGSGNVESRLAEALHMVLNFRLVPRQGSTGRTYATEVLLVTQPMALALRENDFNRMQNILQTSRQDGMITLDLSLQESVVAGEISPESALTVAHDPTRLQGLFKK